MRGEFGLSVKSERFLRPLIGVIVAYAIAAQSLLIALGGLPVSAQAYDGTSGFEVCLHATQHEGKNQTQLPVSNPDQPGCTHCIFCFAGAHHAFAGLSAALFHRVDFDVLIVVLLGDEARRPNAPSHSIASPRGPPPAA
jgi:hypothetical protein